MTEPRCVHCKQNKGQIKMRWLCYSCWRDKEIRARYPTRNESSLAALDVSKLTPVMPDRCVHGIRDGLCPQCEREQRALMAMEGEEQEEIEAA